MASRKLRVLVIHDTNFAQNSARGILGTDDLDLCSVQWHDDFTDPKNWVHDWLTVLGFLAGQVDIEQPDLMVIDCQFQDDKSHPRPLRGYGPKDPDPRGMLYGALLAARFTGERRLPLGFALYSQDLPAVSKYPEAKTFYGCLEAILGAPIDLYESGGGQFERAMAAVPAGRLPQDVVGDAIRRYRASLEERMGRELWPEPDTFHSAARAVQAFVDGGSPPAEDLAVAWRVPGRDLDTILLASLFVDCRTAGGGWDPAALETSKAVDFLQQMGAAGVPKRVVASVQPVLQAWVDRLNPTSASFEALPEFNWAYGDDGKWQQAVCLAFVWAVDRCAHGKYPRAHPKLTKVNDLSVIVRPDLDSDNSHYRSAGRALGKVINGSQSQMVSASAFMKTLDAATRWPEEYPPPLRLAVAKLLEATSRQGGERTGKRREWLTRSSWPTSIR